MMIDRLFESVEQRGVVCLGLDTRLDYIPQQFQPNATISDRLFQFNKRIIDATIDVVACYKVQIAYYEAYGIEGLLAYKNTLNYLREQGTIAIADVKRGDIADTASQYAKAHFEGDFESDFITLNAYMGYDTLEPYFPYFATGRKGAFVLVRTSNPGAKDIEYLDCGEKKVYEIVGENTQRIGEQFIGRSGYSAIGAVMGCTNIDEAAKMRSQLDKSFFLIPGFGAQGGSAENVATLLHRGNGGVVNSSRAILLHYRKFEGQENKFDEFARLEAITMNDKIQQEIQRSK